MTNIMNKVEKFNLENAANTKIVKDLRSLLDTLVVKDLKHIGDLFVVNRLSNKKRADLVKIIYDLLTNKDKLSEIIERFVSSEFNLLKRLMDNNGTIQDNNIDVKTYHYLHMVGIVFLFRRNDKFYISITDDVYKTLKEIDLNSFNKIIEDNTKLHDLLTSMIELYGVVDSFDLADTYCKYYGNCNYKDIPENSLYFVDRIDNFTIFHTEHNLFYVNNILDNDRFESILDAIVERQTKIKRKPIELNKLLKYKDLSYYEITKERTSFEKYLIKCGLSKNNVKEIILNMINMFKLGHSYIQVIFSMLEDYGLEITMKEANKILEYIMPIYNNTRIWVNNGWTPIEMRENYNK